MHSLIRSAGRVAAVACLATLAATGCGRSGPEMASVRGTVTYNGSPLTKGTVSFVSPDPNRSNASSPIGSD